MGKYKTASAWYLFGSLFNKGIAFLTVPVFTRILSTADYGIISTYNSWIGITSMVIGFALHMAVRMACIDYKERIDGFMSSISLFTIASACVCCSLVSLVVQTFHIDVNLAMINICILHSTSVALIDDYVHLLMMKYKYKRRTFLLVLPNLLSVALSVVVILYVLKTDLYWGRIVPTAATHVCFGLVVLWIMLQKARGVFKTEYIRYGLAISAPLILHGIALNVLSQSDRTMITLYSGASQTGIYSLVYNFSMLSLVITSSLEGVWIPWFTQHLSEGDRDAINKRACQYVLLISLVIVGLMLVSPELIKLMSDLRYWEGISIVPPVVLANYVIFVYTLYVNIEHYHKKTPYITVNTLVAATTNLVLNFIFIPRFGYVAAAFTTLASYIVSLLMHASYAKKLEPDLYPIRMFLPPFAMIVCGTAVYYLFVDLPVWRISIMILSAAWFAYAKRELIKDILKKK